MEEIRTPAEVFEEVFGRGNGRQRTEVREAGRQVPAGSMYAGAWSRYGTSWLRVSLWPVSAALWLVMLANVAALALYGLAYMTRNITAAAWEPSVEQLGVWVHQVSLESGDLTMAGMAVLTGPLGLAPGPAAAATLATGAFVGRRVVRAMSSSLSPRRPVRVPRAVALAPAQHPLPGVIGVQQKRAARIAGVQAALAQLDAEWLSYEMDLDAYYLTKPLLRDPNVAQTAAYQLALYELRGRAEALGDTCTAAELDEAEQAADAALMAWGAANDHALAVGLSDRSPTERAALRRLHALTAQLTDSSTPKPMWPSLIGAITREMGKLTTVTASWEHLSRVPALEQRNPVAIAAASSE